MRSLSISFVDPIGIAPINLWKIMLNQSKSIEFNPTIQSNCRSHQSLTA